jgi:UDP-N-acetylmuramate--alanine ligase
MRSFAETLLRAGCEVTGMDAASAAEGTPARKLARSDVHELREIPWSESPDWHELGDVSVVHTLAVSPDAPPLQSARRAGMKVQSLPAALGDWFAGHRQVCVAGTHGKSTTAAMIVWILEQSGRSPDRYIGSALWPAAERSGSAGRQRRTVVIESCEYRGAFHALRPQTAVLTGIEPDHFDCYRQLDEAAAAYRRFLSGSQPEGTIVVNADSAVAVDCVAQAARERSLKVAMFSVSGDRSGNPRAGSVLTACVRSSARPAMSRATASDIHGEQFELWREGRLLESLQLSVPGSHNIANAVAAIAAAEEEGVPLADAARHVQSFPGLPRRLEFRGFRNGVALMDDFAHHPTAVRCAMTAVRRLFPGCRLIVAFEPHQASRLSALFGDFAAALQEADECLVLPVFAAREDVPPGDCARLSGRLVRQINESGGRALLMPNLDQARGRLDHSARPGDVILTLGAGRIGRIHDEITRRLSRHPAA